MSHPPVGPPDASANPRYAGVETFARRTQLRDVPHANIVVIDVFFASAVC